MARPESDFVVKATSTLSCSRLRCNRYSLLKLVNELQGDERNNRNTYFSGIYDADERLIRCEKRVYGEIELLHNYQYHANGSLQRAEITDADGDVTVLWFDASGRAVNPG